MVGRKNKYDSACYYAGKKIGGCTVADGDAYVVLMNQCNYHQGTAQLLFGPDTV